MALNRERLEELFKDYYRSIFHFFLNRGIAREESRDMAQETFSRALKGIGDFRSEASDKTWLFRIARNLWLNKLRDRARARRRISEVSLDEAFPEEESVSDQGIGLGKRLSPEEIVLHGESVERLYAALKKLPPQRRRCLILRLEDLKYQEIADLMQISLQAVRSHLFQGRKQLQQLLSQELGQGI